MDAQPSSTFEEILERQDEFEELFITFWDRNPKRIDGGAEQPADVDGTGSAVAPADTEGNLCTAIGRGRPPDVSAAVVNLVSADWRTGLGGRLRQQLRAD